jgi:hypothetical protein
MAARLAPDVVKAQDDDRERCWVVLMEATFREVMSPPVSDGGPCQTDARRLLPTVGACMLGPRARSTGDTSCRRCAGVEGCAIADDNHPMGFLDTWRSPDALIQKAHAEVSHGTHQYSGWPTPYQLGWHQRLRRAEQPGHTCLWPWRTAPCGVVRTRRPHDRGRHLFHA